MANKSKNIRKHVRIARQFPKTGTVSSILQRRIVIPTQLSQNVTIEYGTISSGTGILTDMYQAS